MALPSTARFAAIFALASLLTTALLAPDAHAQRQPGNFGIGAGSSTIASGLSIKQHAGPSAFQLTAGCWSWCDGVAASLDGLASMPTFAGGELASLAWNFGIGGAAGVGDGEIGVAAAFVLGLEVLFQNPPVDVVLEWRPGLGVIPEPSIDLFGVGAHIRFYP